MKKISLKDLAKLADVHPSTVSRVLNDSPGIRVNPRTRERIFRLASEHNYKPDISARNLKLRRTLTIAMLVPDVSNPFFHLIIKGVEQTANEMGYGLLLSHMDGRLIKDLHIRMISERKVDGLLLDWALQEDKFLAELSRADVPFVLMNRRSDTTNRYISLDDVAGAKLGMDHLIKQGHRRIAHLAGPLSDETAIRRIQGYRSSLCEHNIGFDNTLVVESGFTFEGGRAGARRFLQIGKRFTAVFCTNLMVAVGALHEFLCAGLNVPHDMSIVGINDTPLAEMVCPQLTMVDMPLYELGQESTKELINIIKGKETNLPKMLPAKELVIRGSTAELKKAI